MTGGFFWLEPHARYLTVVGSIPIRSDNFYVILYIIQFISLLSFDVYGSVR